MNDIMKIVKSLKDTGFLIKNVGERVENKVKEQKRGFLGILFITLGAALLGSMALGKKK